MNALSSLALRAESVSWTRQRAVAGSVLGACRRIDEGGSRLVVSDAMKAWLVAVLHFMPAIASATQCRDKVACETACEAGDPAACVLVLYSPFKPLEGEKVPPARDPVTRCSHAPISCDRYLAHLWAGVGIKQQRDVAVAVWNHECSDSNWIACFLHAKAIEPKDPLGAGKAYREVCKSRGIDLACSAGGKLWSRVTGQRDGTAFSIELPAILAPVDTGDGWSVVFAGSSRWPDISVSVEGGKLLCKPGARPTTKWLPSGWLDRACKSLQKTP